MKDCCESILELVYGTIGSGTGLPVKLDVADAVIQLSAVLSFLNSK